MVDIVLGFGSLEDWTTKNAPYLGAVVGRVGNRINKGKFSLEGKDYALVTNNGGHHLHGGNVGFDKVGCVCGVRVPFCPRPHDLSPQVALRTTGRALAFQPASSLLPLIVP